MGMRRASDIKQKMERKAFVAVDLGYKAVRNLYSLYSIGRRA